MVVDTSALLAVLFAEPGSEPILDTLLSEQGLIPAPAIVEFWRVVMERGSSSASLAQPLLDSVRESGTHVVAFDAAAAEAAVAANLRYGAGVARGGRLNMLDLMVYGVAKTTGRPILCTGNDFASTDAAIHPASRIDGQSSSSS